ncbi:hypothetical protein [Reyranella sp. CPCC 100927]|uniref:COG4648 family protein n=1 Tax=Reyranella sp. CPCC 100927 TaxID=2599616 RepID=UPI0015B592D6|nr:hypothetical protein [Reyranella sp. CPCC 100927]
MPESGKWSDPWLIVVGVGTLAYPIIVYLGLPHLPPYVLVVLALLLMAGRALFARSDRLPAIGPWGMVWCGGVLALLLLIAPLLAAKAYPVVLSLALAVTFAASLVRPPTLIERLARLQHPALPAPAIGYTRIVTWVWTVFLLGNGALAAGLAVWGSLEQWTLWTSLGAYLATGVIFAIEWSIRQVLLRRWAS